jgi:DNA repair protein RadC
MFQHLSDAALVAYLVGEKEAKYLLSDGLSTLASAAAVASQEPLVARDCAAQSVAGDLGEVQPIQKIAAAMELAARFSISTWVEKPMMNKPEAVIEHLRQRIAHLPYEVFQVLFLDATHRLISSEQLFRGTLNQTAVYPREILVRALKLNAAAIIVAHNHPSGTSEPSNADETLPENLRKMLSSVGINLLDHIIVTGSQSTSMARRGFLAL